MAPRKSNVSVSSNHAANEEGTPTASSAAAGAGAGASSTPAKDQRADGINIEDLSLPRTMIQRLAKGVLPPNTQIQKDAVLALQKGATVFVNYLASQANATTLSTTNRKTVPPQAIFDALRELEFADFVPRVEAELDKFVSLQTSKRNDYRKKIKEKDGGVNGTEGDETSFGPNEDNSEINGERSTKRPRISGNEESLRASSPSAQLLGQAKEGRSQENGQFDPDVDPDPEHEDGEDTIEDEEEVELLGDDEEDEEEPEEDEYPDEGRRADSMEMDEDDAGGGGSKGREKLFDRRDDGAAPFESSGEDDD